MKVRELRPFRDKMLPVKIEITIDCAKDFHALLKASYSIPGPLCDVLRGIRGYDGRTP
jgi:hypothetical protein